MFQWEAAKTATTGKGVFTSHLLAALVAFTVTFLVYSPTLRSGFVWDDAHTIKESLVFDKSNPYSFLFSGGTYYRPAVFLTFYLDRALWGTQPQGFHLSNVLLHSFNALLVYAIWAYLPYCAPGTRTLPSGGLEQSGQGLEPLDRRVEPLGQKFVPRLSTILPPLAASLFFSLHPVNSEAVAWISGRTDVLATFFFLLAFFCILVYEVEKKDAILFCVFVLSLFSMMSKENGASFVILFLCYASSAGWDGKKLVKGIYFVVAAVVVYVLLRIGAGSVPDLFSTSGGKSFFYPGMTRLSVVQSMVYATGYYVGKLLVPTNLNLLPQFTGNPANVLFYLVLLLAAAMLYLKRRRWELFFVAWVAVTLLPSLLIAFSGVAYPVGERYMYLPSVGYAFLLSFALFSNVKVKTASVLSFLLILSFGFCLAGRIGVWQNELALWASAANGNPASATARTNYGVALLMAKDYVKAEKELNAALIIDVDGYVQLSILYDALANVAIVNADSKSTGKENRGIENSQMGQNRLELAEKYLYLSIKTDPNNIDAYNNLGCLYIQKSGRLSGERKKEKEELLLASLRVFNHALSIDPGSLKIKFNMGISYLKLNDTGNAIKTFTSVVEADPGSEEAHRILSEAMNVKKGGY
ncbi:MAG: hypothetical protein HQK89_01375 [Nitrospirae bacterium]|nr:hypothetical protein [Nitrospirota bacterium]